MSNPTDRPDPAGVAERPEPAAADRTTSGRAAAERAERGQRPEPPGPGPAAAERREPGERVELVDGPQRPELGVAAERAQRYLAGMAARPVGPPAIPSGDALGFDAPLPDGPTDPAEVVALLADLAEPGIVASAGPRYFGFVTGGTLPAALGADWLTSAWDQNTALAVMSPAAAAAEQAAGRWLLELLGLPATASFAFVTGAQGANTVALAAARHHVLAAAGWDVERQGLIGAPAVRVLAGAERHATIDRSLRLLGLGTDAVMPVRCDDQGRVVAEAMVAELGEGAGPTIVSLQAGNVNTGSFDPIDEIVDAAHAAGAWVHVDGAFGLWAGAAPGRRALVRGIERCDSWSTDGHKWLNVPYDCGLVFCAHPDSHRAAFTMAAAYLVPGGGREPWDWSPEASRRARVFPVWAALRSLGRSGVADLVERCCRLAERFASRLAAEGFTIGNEVVLNQVLVAAADDDATLTLAGALQADGTAWAGTTVWQGRAWIRISVSSWATTEADVDATVAALARLAGSTRA